MPDLTSKFTDSNLKLFYRNLLDHYNDCANRRGNDIHAIYNELFLATQYAVESGSLSHLDHTEKAKVYTSFNTIFYALPLYTRMPAQQQRSFNPPRPQYNPQIIYINTPNSRNYNCNDSFFFNWLLLSELNRCSYPRYHHGGRVHTYPGSGSSSSNVHRHGGTSSKTDGENKGNALAALVLVVLALSAAAATFIALYYMLQQGLNGIERMWYGEGWLRASLMLASSIAFGATSTILTLTVGSAPIIALAVAAGFNPVGVVIFAAVCFGIMAAGIGGFVMNLLHDSLDKKANKDAMDPSDPYRFRVTASEEKALLKQNIDPVKVKCAMVALRAEMSTVLGGESAVPSFLSRHLGSKKSQDVHALLKQVRALRGGELCEVKVGELKFDCRMPQPVYAYNPHSSNLPPSTYQQYAPSFLPNMNQRPVHMSHPQPGQQQKSLSDFDPSLLPPPPPYSASNDSFLPSAPLADGDDMRGYTY
jgi:hypothetical protein